jgi:hypothetical protein
LGRTGKEEKERFMLEIPQPEGKSFNIVLTSSANFETMRSKQKNSIKLKVKSY